MWRRARVVFAVGVIVLVLAVVVMRGIRTQASGRQGLPAVRIATYPTGIAVDDRTGRAFVASNLNGTGAVTVLDTRTGAAIRTVLSGRNAGAAAVFEPAGRIFITDDQGVGVLDARTGDVLRTLHVGFPYVLAVDRRTRRVFAGDNDTVSVLDAGSGVVLHTTRLGLSAQALQANGMVSLAVDEVGGHALVATAGDNRLRVLDARNGRIVYTIPVGVTPWSMAVDGRTGRAYVVNSGGNSVSIVDTRRGALIGTTRVGLSPVAVALDAGTGRVFVTNANHGNVVTNFTMMGSVSVLDAANGRVLRTVTVGWEPETLAVSERARRVYVFCQGHAYVLDARDGRLTRTIVLPQGTAPLPSTQPTVDERGSRLYVGLSLFIPGADHTSFFDVVGAILGRLSGRPRRVSSYSPPPSTNAGMVVTIDTRKNS